MITFDSKLRQELAGMSAKEAAEIICNEFNLGHMPLIFALTGKETCAYKILQTKGAVTISASDISPIKFFGGPPNARGHYQGTLLTLVCDLVLFYWTTKHQYTDLVIGYDKLQTA
jgi:hypothetical protein